MYNDMISRRLNDISNYPDFLANICFESCKMQQVWPDFMTFNRSEEHTSELQSQR